MALPTCSSLAVQSKSQAESGYYEREDRPYPKAWEGGRSQSLYAFIMCPNLSYRVQMPVAVLEFDADERADAMPDVNTDLQRVLAHYLDRLSSSRGTHPASTEALLSTLISLQPGLRSRTPFRQKVP